MTSTISSKGQITVPKAVRDKLGLRPGARVEFELTADGALLRKGHRAGVRAVDRVLGILKREAATDSLLIGQYADAVLLSLLRDVSQAPRVYAACQRLGTLGIRILGTVVHGMQQEEVYTGGYTTAAA